MSTVDERAVEEARRQILAIVDQIRALAQGDVKEAEFFSALLAKSIEAMGAVGGIVWLVRDQGRVESVTGQGVEHTGIAQDQDAQAAHGKLVGAPMGNPTGLIVPPRAGLTNADGSAAASNPTDLLVVAAPIDRDGTREGYDLKTLRAVTDAVDVPVIACGGAGTLADLASAIHEGGASAAAAGSLFVFQGKLQAVLISYPSPKELRELAARPRP